MLTPKARALAAFFTGLFNLVRQGAAVGFDGVFGYVLFPETDQGPGNDADAALVGHGGGQVVKGNTYAHAALDNGQRDGFVTDV